MSGRTKKSLLNFLSSIVKTVGILAVTFVTTPILIRWIGAEDFGAFKVLLEVHGYLNLIEMGLLTSIIITMIPLFKNQDKKEIKELMDEGTRRYWKVTLWTLLLGLAFFPFLKKISSWDGDSTDLYLTFGLLLSTYFFIPSNSYRAYLEASNQGHKVHLINFGQSLCFTLLAVVFAYFGFKIKSQAMALLISTFLGATLLRFFSDIKVSWRNKENHFSSKVFSQQKPQVLNELAGKLCVNLDQIIISIFLGPFVVTKVFLGQRVVQIMQQQLLSLGQSSWASLGNLYYQHEGDLTLFNKRTMEMTKILAVFAVAGLVPICILNHAFIELWVGDGLFMDEVLVYLASANAFFWGIFCFWGFIFTILGKPGSITKILWFQAGINLIASIAGTKILGGIGPIAGTLISYLIIPLWMYPKLMEKHFKISQTQIFSSFMGPLILGITVLTLYQFMPVKLIHLSWMEFIFWGLSIFISNGSLLFVLAFNAEEKTFFLERIKIILKMKA